MQDATVYARPGLAEQQAHFGAEWCPSTMDFWSAPMPFEPAAPISGEPIFVYANQGRWVAECPDCRGAQLACATDPRFMCHCCANVANSRHWRHLIWPKNGTKKAIEEVLNRRPLYNQNWRPGETVAALVAENVEHGIDR